MGCQVSYIKNLGKLRIIMSPGFSIKIISDEELIDPNFQTFWRSLTPTEPYDQNDPRSVNEVLKVQRGELNPVFTSELIQLQPFHTLYLHSNLTTYDSMDVTGRRSIVARIPLLVQFGYVNHWEPSLEAGWFDVSEMTFRNLSFSLRNARGTVVPLHGTHMSSHLIFD